MADGIPISQTQIETWQEDRPQISGTLLAQSSTSELHGQSFPKTSHIARKAAVGAAAQKPASDPDIFPRQPLSESYLCRQEFRNENRESHEHYSMEAETPAMIESPGGSLREHSDRNSTPRTRSRGVTYTSSTSSPGFHHDPFQQDSAHVSTGGPQDQDSSDDDSDTREQQLRARERVVILRRRVLKTRQIRRKSRDSLGQLRERTRSALDKLTQKINELAALNRLQEGIGLYYEEFCAAQDELGPAEHEYESLENRLENEEQDLEEEEEQYYELYRYKKYFEASHQGSRVERAVSSSTKLDDKPNNTNQILIINSNLLQEYFSKIDEALALRRELQNLEDDYYRVSEDANLRRRNGFPLFATMSSFLADYPTSRAEILDSLYQAEENIFDLRDECIKQGVFSRDEHRYEPRDALRDELLDAVDEALERSPLRVAAQHVKHPEEIKQEISNKRDYVNKWLLEWVQESTVDMMMLRTFIYIKCPGISETPHKTLVEMGDDKWTEYSLKNWYTDEAGNLADHFYNASRFDAIAGDTNVLNIGSTRWSQSSDSLRSSLHVAPNYDPSIDLDFMESDPASVATQSGGFDTTPTKPKYGDGANTPTTLDINETSPEIGENSDDSPISPTTVPELTNTTAQSPSVSRLPPMISYGSNPPPPRIDEPEHTLSPNTSITTSRAPSLTSNTNSFTSLAPSERSARTSFDATESPASKPLLSPQTYHTQPSKPETSETPPSKSRFLEAPKNTLSRSSSLKAPKRPTHHLSRRSLDYLTTQLTLHPALRKSASFTRE
ncbi:hypothetical protein ONS95_007507 [Cadophora gregata]|uniref:uncharacterized protein n=1 Tax=Cadophora gregata TaxID=51156 RepID=UPI0026DC8888|nr:uncharacterized protein ONS95_007507 [Cadophora gregata]KAK0118623.1 hypothetical protein ONS96_011713 [Cadophora gregata f. sp. sojae]KAK0125880.1 hypothetical protein ONS95_007507 [Cadophora gregata]